MATTVRLPGGEAKIRNLWIVAVLLVVTLGLYYLYWYYAINRELRDTVGTRMPTSKSILGCRSSRSPSAAS